MAIITRILPVILLLMSVFAAHAQPSNVRVGALTGFADNNFTYGVTAGFDKRIGRAFISADVDAFHLCKHAGNGGCGYEYQVRGVVGFKVTKTLAIQGGMARSQYKVERYGKSSVQYIVGARYVYGESLVSEFNYRRDLTSPNDAHFIEARVTKYMGRHLFFRVVPVFSVLRDSGRKTAAGSLTLAAGVHF